MKKYFYCLLCVGLISTCAAVYNVSANTNQETPAPAQAGRFWIFAKFGDKQATIYCDPSDTILNIKSKIEVLLKVPRDKQRLIFAVKQLEEGHTLRDYSIMHESTIHVHYRS